MWRWLTRRRRATNAATTPELLRLLYAQLQPHFCETLFFTGAFLVAWSWDLVLYAGSHARAAESPLHNQLAFTSAHRNRTVATWSVAVLLFEYFLACAVASMIDWYLIRYQERAQQPLRWSVAAARQAVEFFPSPVFAGKLMAFLSETTNGLHPVEIAFLNLGITLGCAVIAHAATTTRTATIVHEYVSGNARCPSWLSLEPFDQTGTIICEALGFGLGIAWNVLLAEWIGPDASPLYQGSFHIVLYWFAFTGYLLFVCLLALRLATPASGNGDDQESATIWDRQRSLLSFAANVVAAFTLVSYGNALFQPNWVGSLQCLGVLLLISALASALLAQTNLQSDTTISRDTNPDTSPALPVPIRPVCDALTVIPCVWCCCPWLPLLWLLSNDDVVGLRQRWYHVISLVTGLACSIEASGMLTALTDFIALSAGVCGPKHCRSPWLFVGIQFLVAVTTTMVLLVWMARLPPRGELPGARTAESARSRERIPLLSKFRSSRDWVRSETI